MYNKAKPTPTVRGKVIIKDVQAVESWLSSSDCSVFFKRNWSEKMQDWNEGEKIGFCSLQETLVGIGDAVSSMEKNYRTRNLIEQATYNAEIGQPFDMYYADDRFVFFGGAGKDDLYILPARFCEVERFVNYDALTTTELRLIGGGESRTSMYPARTDDVSVASINNNIEAKKKEISDRQNEIEALEKEKLAEIEAFKRELEERMRDKTELLNAKMAELNAMKDELTRQLDMLEAEIYAIRCYNGETVSFTRLASGKNAPDSDSIVIFQKLRFLDEEMGKIAAIYDFDGNDEKFFEKLLVNNNTVLQTFLPANKCLSIVKVSRNGLGYKTSDKCENMLSAYQKYHGTRLAILLRNGENIYVGWLDEEKISIRDDNVFLAPSETISDVDSDERDHTIDGSKESTLGRYYIFAILQGLIGKLVSFPEPVNVTVPSQYIIYSMATNWVTDNTYGAFSDILKKFNARPLSEGDMILTTQKVTRDDAYGYGARIASQYEKYSNDRGRGERNRTGGCAVSDCTLYPINQIDVTRYYSLCFLKYPYASSTGEPDIMGRSKYEDIELQGPPSLHYETVSFTNWKNGAGTASIRQTKAFKEGGMEEYLRIFADKYYSGIKGYWRSSMTSLSEREVYRLEYIGYEERPDKEDYQYYVAIRKEAFARWDSTYSVNFEVKRNYDEFLDLTYLNSVYLRYVIINRNLGTWCQKGDYAYALRYLNTALDYVREREKKEAELLSKYMPLYDKWQVDVSEWRYEHNYHSLTDARAKSFAKWKLAQK